MVTRNWQSNLARNNYQPNKGIYHDFHFYSILLGTQVVNLSLLSQAVITRLVVLSGYLPLAGLIPVMQVLYKM